MGLFSFIGKALKTVGKVASFVPGVGGIVGKVAGTVGNLLDAKRPMSGGSVKLATAARAGPATTRGNVTAMGYMGTPWRSAGVGTPAVFARPVLRASPVMPGGAVSTPNGMMEKSSQPPLVYGQTRRRGVKRRRKAVSRTTSRKRRTTRKLKFGSKAWRARYMKRKR